MSHFKTFAVSAFLILFLTQCREESRFYSNVQRSDVFIQLYDEAKYDFLWVMDNSPSMLPRREFVRDNMQTFLNVLNSRKAIDYRMSLTTTDYGFPGVLPGDEGDLIATNSGTNVVLSGASNPVADFAGIINNIADSSSSFWEQSLESMYAAIFKHKSIFSRRGVPLNIIILTDADDWSCQSNCFGSQPESQDPNDPNSWRAHPVSRYINYLNAFSASNESEINVFPIMVTPEEACSTAADAVGPLVTHRPIQVMTAVGNSGVSGSICPSKLANSFLSIAQIIADRGAVFRLSNNASGLGINVFIDQILVPNAPENYIYDASINSIVFTGVVPKKGQSVQVTYNEKVN